MWAAKTCVYGAAFAALSCAVAAGAGGGEGDGLPITPSLPLVSRLTERPLFLRDNPVPPPLETLRADDRDGAIRTAPIPPAALTGVLLVGGIIFTGIARRRNK